MKKELVDTLYCMKLTKKNNTNLVYYLAKVSIDDKLQEMGYERLPQNKCKGSGSRRSLPIADVIFGWNGEKYLVEPVHKHKLENKSIYFTLDEFHDCLNHEAFEGENMVYSMEVKSYDVYNYIPDDLKELYKDMDKDEDIVWDIETTGLDRFTDEITSIQFSWISKESKKERDCFLVYDEFTKEEWTKLFKKLSDKKLVAHNGKFDSLFIYEKLGGIQLPLTDDTLCMSHCTDNEEYGLKPNVLKWFHHDYDIDTKDKTGKVTKKLKFYGILDVIYTRKLKRKLEPRLDMWGTRKIYNHEIRAYRAYYKVEQVGVPLSDRAGEISKQLEEEASVIKERLLKVANINWASNPQVATVMFSPEGEPIYAEPKKHKWVTSVLNDTHYKTKKEATEDLKAQGYKPKEMGLEAHEETTQELLGYGLGLKPKGKTSSGKYKVDKDVLAEYSSHPVIKDLIEWKSLDKLKQFPDKWMEMSHNGRIYPSFNLTARTGRTTCSNPNLQQVPQSSSVRNLIGGKKGMKCIECFSGDTEVLSKNGWVKFSELKQDYTELAQYDIKTGEISFAKPLNYIHQKDRETFHYEDRNTSIFATANHNVLTKWRPGQQASKNAFKDTNFSRGHAFVNAGKFDNGVKDEWVARYIAMFNADGSMNKEGYVIFGFSKERKIKRCRFILDKLGVDYSVRKFERPNGTVDINFYVGKRTNDLINTYTDRSKTLKWSCLKTLDINSFVDEIQYWDSTLKEQGGVRFTTTNLETAKVTQAMLVLTNHKSTLRKDFSNYNHTNGYHSKVYYLNYKPHKEETITYMSGEAVDFTKPVVQDVYCATMPLGTLVIRHNDKVSMQGNCDFSQAELRVASMFAGDENMQHAYNSGSDLHSKTTELLFGDTSQLGHDEQKRLRTYSKSMNFGFLYGMSAKTFVGYAKTYGLNLTQDESEKLREDFFNAYPRLPEWHDECKAFLHKHGYSYSPSGRKRFFPQVYSNNPRIVASAERGCVNAGVQGFASDLCVSALADVVFSEELDHSKFNVIGSVHDAILLEVQEDYAQELGKKVQEIMSHPSILDDLGIEMPVPLKADLSIGDAWGMEE